MKNVGAEPRQEAYMILLELAEHQGYVTFDNIMDCSDRFALSIQDFDWLSNSITTYGVIVYADAPTKITQSSDEEYDDFAQSDYEKVYNRIVALDPSLKSFIDGVRTIIPPQKNEICQLKYQIAEGNSFARARMIEMHLRVALRVALQRAEAYDMDIGDAVGYACIGLTTAVDKYDPDTSGAFSSYAALWIIQNISRAQPTQRPLVYYPVHEKERYFTMYPILKKQGCIGCPELYKCEKAKKIIMEQITCDDKSAMEVIAQMIPDEFLPIPITNLYADEEHLELSHFCLNSYDDTILLEDDALKTVVENERANVVRQILDTLKSREADVLRARYGFSGKEKTLGEVGQKYGLTRERIRQIETKAIRKLRHPSRLKKLKDFYE